LPATVAAEEVGVEGAALLGAGIEGVEELEQHEGGEGQGQRIGLPMRGQAMLEHEQGADHHRQAIQRLCARRSAAEDLAPTGGVACRA
jgi:hypothetical protein